VGAGRALDAAGGGEVIDLLVILSIGVIALALIWWA
jgi:hypothetical protein